MTTQMNSTESKPFESQSADRRPEATGVAQQVELEVFPTFDEMPLHQNLLRGIYAHGFEKPSTIQQRAIVPMARGGDIIAQSQSGTGKTGAFTIGLLARADFSVPNLQVVVLSPTRELAAQTQSIISSIGDFMGYKSFCQLFVGGTKVQDDIRKLQARPIVAVGTPGRIWDLIERGDFQTQYLKLLVLDEADEMLSAGFSEQIYSIFKFLPNTIQVALFSATIPDDVLELTTKFMRNPVQILMKKETVTLDGIKQFYIDVEKPHKLETLMDLYDSISIAQSVVFVNTKNSADFVAAQLNERGQTVSCIHSDMKKEERDRVMEQFRSGSSRVLVTTDLVARGIDIQHVNIVINFDISDNKENYIHRIGRCGRYGKRGVAINLVSTDDQENMRAIEIHYKTRIEELPMDFTSYLCAP
jgi:translation initiation factor 4A